MRPDFHKTKVRSVYQVKIRGSRVEIVEIEMALLALDSVKEAVVVPREDQHGEQRLVAYLVPASRPAPTVSGLRRALADRLPDYMMPSAFVVLESLPLGATGKVDRQALLEPTPTRPELGNPFIAPRNRVEAQLTKIWEEVLGIQPIGVEDNFFELGGSSLDYLSLSLEMEEEFGRTLPIAGIGPSPTIEYLAKLLEQPDSLLTSVPKSVDRHRLSSYLAIGLNQLSSGGVQRVLSKIVFQRGPVLGKIVLPYAMGARFLAWFCDRRWIQSILFRRQVRLVQECLPLVTRSADDQSDVIRRSLSCNLWGQWRRIALSRCTAEEFERWVTITGFSTFQKACQEGHGVVLITSHLASLGFIWTALHRGGDDLVGVGYQYSFLEAPESLSLASQLYEGKQVLERGGIVMIVADGYIGSSPGIALSLFGRSRIFRTGFAELAVSTGAAIVPVSVSMDTTGHVDVRFLPPS